MEMQSGVRVPPPVTSSKALRLAWIHVGTDWADTVAGAAVRGIVDGRAAMVAKQAFAKA